MTALVMTRTARYYDLPGSKVVKIGLVDAVYNAGLKTTLGIQDTVPQSATVVGSGRVAAVTNGCFPIVVVYQRNANRVQTARVLCSPTKADTVFTEVRGKNYRTFPIIDSRPVRRRILLV